MARINDRDYHQARALEELRRAEEADDPAVACIHRELAALHRRRLLELVIDAGMKESLATVPDRATPPVL